MDLHEGCTGMCCVFLDKDANPDCLRGVFSTHIMLTTKQHHVGMQGCVNQAFSSSFVDDFMGYNSDNQDPGAAPLKPRHHQGNLEEAPRSADPGGALRSVMRYVGGSFDASDPSECAQDSTQDAMIR